MTAIAIGLDRLIREAKQRARRRRALLAASALAVPVVGAVTYTQLSKSSAAVLPACTTSDYRVSVGGEPATQLFVGNVAVNGVGVNPCRFDRTVTMTVLDGNGMPIAARGNPGHWRVSGKVSRADSLRAPWTWGMWCGGKPVTFSVRIGRGPVVTSSATPPSFACDTNAEPALTRLRQ